MTNEDIQTAGTADGKRSTETDERVMNLLSEHVPLSLIVDLSTPEGPDSQEILTEEGEPEDAWWDVAGDGSAAGDDEPEGSDETA